MLDLPERREGQVRPGPDPAVSLTVAFVAAAALGLLLAGFLAVYDYQTPGAELPAVLAAVGCFAGALVIRVGVSATRFLRREQLR